MLYVNARKKLQGKFVSVKNRKSKQPIVWTVSDDEDHITLINQDEEDKTKIGLTCFDFKRNEVNDGYGRPNRRINFMKLFFALWPGNIHHQLLLLNARIERENQTRRKGRVLPISLREFAQFLGIMLVARLEGKSGTDLWQHQRGRDAGEGYRSELDVSKFMTRHRHSQIRRYFSFLFADENKKCEDPWWQVVAGIDGFNHNRRSVFSPSRVRVLDELMSAFRPRTSPTGTCTL